MSHNIHAYISGENSAQLEFFAFLSNSALKLFQVTFALEESTPASTSFPNAAAILLSFNKIEKILPSSTIFAEFLLANPVAPLVPASGLNEP